jgi:predicted component of type VI protein secretion system
VSDPPTSHLSRIFSGSPLINRTINQAQEGGTMRSSSVKTLVSAVTLTFTLVIAAPPAEARPSQPKRPSQSAPSMTERAQRAVRQLLQRVFGISANESPSDPFPKFAPGASETLTESPSDPFPVRP